MASEALRTAVVQMNSQDDVTANLAVVRQRVAEAARAGAKLVLLPENFAFLGGSTEQRLAVAETVSDRADGPIVTTLRGLARDHALMLVAGGMAETSPDVARPYNSCVAFGPDGHVLAHYRKIHLFDVDVADGQQYMESSNTTPGDEAMVIPCGPFTVGLSVCYDVRFPELYRRLVTLGADVLVVPAAFTLMTGKDHWHVLLRARAIESQAYVLAAAQWGVHPQGRQTYGKSLVVDPWGDIIAQASDGEGVVVAMLEPDRIRAIRRRLPSLRHRRL